VQPAALLSVPQRRVALSALDYEAATLSTPFSLLVVRYCYWPLLLTVPVVTDAASVAG
jgi:hypothetical protein